MYHSIAYPACALHMYISNLCSDVLFIFDVYNTVHVLYAHVQVGNGHVHADSDSCTTEQADIHMYTTNVAPIRAILGDFGVVFARNLTHFWTTQIWEMVTKVTFFFVIFNRSLFSLFAKN